MHWAHWSADLTVCHLAGKWEQSWAVYWVDWMAAQTERQLAEHWVGYWVAKKADWWGDGMAAPRAECLAV